MSMAIGDHVFQKLASIGVQRVVTRSRSTIFAGSIRRNNLTLSNQPPAQPAPTEILCFLSSSEDLTVCFNEAARFFGYRHVILIQELDSARFVSTQTQTANLDFAAATILNSPLTAIAQIDRMVTVLSYAVEKPVYIGLGLPVAGTLVSGAGQGSGSENERAEGKRAVVGREEEEVAEAALAMSMLR